MKSEKVVNYTTLKRRERSIYSIGGYSLPVGLPLDVLISVVICEIVCHLLIILPILHFFDIKYMDWNNGKVMRTLMFIALPAMLGGGLVKMKVKGYKLFEYILVLLTFIGKKKYRDIDGNVSDDYKQKTKIFISEGLK